MPAFYSFGPAGILQAAPGRPPEKFLTAPCFAHFFPSHGIEWEEFCKGGTTMEHSYPHGDVDDLIYQEEWTVSSR